MSHVTGRIHHWPAHLRTPRPHPPRRTSGDRARRTSTTEVVFRETDSTRVVAPARPPARMGTGWAAVAPPRPEHRTQRKVPSPAPRHTPPGSSNVSFTCSPRVFQLPTGHPATDTRGVPCFEPGRDMRAAPRPGQQPKRRLRRCRRMIVRHTARYRYRHGRVYRGRLSRRHGGGGKPRPQKEKHCSSG